VECSQAPEMEGDSARAAARQRQANVAAERRPCEEELKDLRARQAVVESLSTISQP
jgi:hypothetical protein